MKTKTTIVLLAIVLMLAHPFGCRSRRLTHVRKSHITTDSTLKYKVKSDIKTREIDEITRKFTEERGRASSKITYREVVTTKKIDLKTEYTLDSIQPEDGSLNFTGKDGDKLNIKTKGNLLQLTQTDSNNSAVVVQNVKELIIEKAHEKESKTVDTSKKSTKNTDKTLDSAGKSKYRKKAEVKVKDKAVERTFEWWKGVIGLLVLGGVVWLVRWFWGRK